MYAKYPKKASELVDRFCYVA